MKKLFAFLFVAMLATSVSFAADWTGSADGEFTADILCTPVLSGPTGAAVDLGNYFLAASPQACPAGSSVSWDFTGPTVASGASYTITYEGDGVSVVSDQAGDDTEIMGSWSKIDEGMIDCSNAQTATYTANTLQTPTAGGLGTKTFTVTLSVSIDI